MIKPFKNLKCKRAKDGHNPVCILKVKTNRNILGINLSPGIYVLKNILKEKISNKDIKMLQELSDLKLIPKIYLIDKTNIIMDYFDGVSLKVYLKNNKLTKNLINKIKNLVRKWHKLGFAHGDLAVVVNKGKILGPSNLLISHDNKLMLIDPMLGKVLVKNISQFEKRKCWDYVFFKELDEYFTSSRNKK